MHHSPTSADATKGSALVLEILVANCASLTHGWLIMWTVKTSPLALRCNKELHPFIRFYDSRDPTVVTINLESFLPLLG